MQREIALSWSCCSKWAFFPSFRPWSWSCFPAYDARPRLNTFCLTCRFLIGLIIADESFEILDLKLQLLVASLKELNAVEHGLDDVVDVIFGGLIHRY